VSKKVTKFDLKQIIAWIVAFKKKLIKKKRDGFFFGFESVNQNISLN
jgi:hypothetical protein